MAAEAVVTCTNCREEPATIAGTTLCRSCAIEESVAEAESRWLPHVGIFAGLAWLIPHPHEQPCECVWCSSSDHIQGQLAGLG